MVAAQAVTSGYLRSLKRPSAQVASHKENPMQFITRDGVSLTYKDTNADLPPMLFVHGYGCDHSVFAPQIEFFSSTHRVVAVDLRGHGESDAPHQDYTMAALADDLAWLSRQLGLLKPVVVGHSMGGNVTLELAARYPEIPASIVMIDSVMLPPQAFVDALRPLGEGLRGQHYFELSRQLLLSLCLVTDSEALKAKIAAEWPAAPQHVLVSALPNHVTEYDATPAATGCRVPVAYIGADVSMVDLIRFKSLTPQLVTAQTLGSGHYSPLSAPSQINAMLTRFLEIYSPRAENAKSVEVQVS
jgi:pimeloyl-ACP methyl ester carboxylesterase